MVGSATSRGPDRRSIGPLFVGSETDLRLFRRCYLKDKANRLFAPLRIYSITGVNSLSPRVLLAVIAIMANTCGSLSSMLSLPEVQLTEPPLKLSISMFWLGMSQSGSKSPRRRWSPPCTTRSRRTLATHLILISSLRASALTTNSEHLCRSPILSTRRRWISATINQLGRSWPNTTGCRRASLKIPQTTASM